MYINFVDFSSAYCGTNQQVPPMLIEIAGDPGSLYLTGVLLWIMALTGLVRKALFSMPNPFLIVQRSFKNFA